MDTAGSRVGVSAERSSTYFANFPRLLPNDFSAFRFDIRLFYRIFSGPILNPEPPHHSLVRA
jgi:hypothetical protein